MTDAELITDFIRTKGVTRCPDGLAIGADFMGGKVDAPAAVVRPNRHLSKPGVGRKPSEETVPEREQVELAAVLSGEAG